MRLTLIGRIPRLPRFTPAGGRLPSLAGPAGSLHLDSRYARVRNVRGDSESCYLLGRVADLPGRYAGLEGTPPRSSPLPPRTLPRSPDWHKPSFGGFNACSLTSSHRRRRRSMRSRISCAGGSTIQKTTCIAGRYRKRNGAGRADWIAIGDLYVRLARSLLLLRKLCSPDASQKKAARCLC